MKRILSLQGMADKHADADVTEQDGKFILTWESGNQMKVPNYDYVFIGGHTLSLAPMMTDLKQEIRQVIAPVKLSSSRVVFAAMKCQIREGTTLMETIDPLDETEDYDYLMVNVDWGVVDGTNGADLAELEKLEGVKVLYSHEEQYGLNGKFCFLLPINTLARVEIAREYRRHLKNLINAGDEYMREFDKNKAKYFDEMMGQVDILQQIDEWELVSTNEEDLELKHTRTNWTVRVRFDKIGRLKLDEILAMYREAEKDSD